jgi:hypothetical protein
VFGAKGALSKLSIRQRSFLQFPTGSVREFELYFERLEAAGLGKIKRPDILIFRASDQSAVEKEVGLAGGPSELPFIAEDDIRLAAILKRALIAVECENSLWRGQKMPDFKTPLRPQKRLGGQQGLKKGAVLPTIIIKEEDREPLRQWQKARRVPIHIWHVFFDLAYGLSFERAEELVVQNLTEPTVQVFQAPGGATTRKTIFKHYYHYGYPLGTSVEEPRLQPACVEDKNGHILPYVTFDGGRLQLEETALRTLRDVAERNR